jgi:hypothetical protein
MVHRSRENETKEVRPRVVNKGDYLCEKKKEQGAKRDGRGVNDDPQKKGTKVVKRTGVIESEGKETLTPNDRYLFHNDPSRVFSCTSPFPMRRGPAPRLIIVFAHVIGTMIHLFVHDRNRSTKA